MEEKTKSAKCRISFFCFIIVILVFPSCQKSQHVSTTSFTQINHNRPVDMVNPLVDSANSRWFFFNAATRPFGMVNLSPDNLLSGAWGSGYRYHTDTIRAFSHIHAWQLSGVPVMPISGPFNGQSGPDDYCSKFSHDNEIVEAGYHKVHLDKYNIGVELTSSKRVGFHKYTFPKSDQNHIVIDLAAELGPCKTIGGMIKKVTNKSLQGYAIMGATRRRPKPVEVFFHIEFDESFDRATVWNNVLEKELKLEEKADLLRAYVSFSSSKKEVRKMKVGLSYVSPSQAKKNMDHEIPHWDFDQIVRESKEEWNTYLSKIEIEGGSATEQSRFYTDLFHALQGRRIINDVDGQYCDRTKDQKRIGQIPLDEQGNPTFNHYNSDSFWGAQWTLNTLWHLIYPKISEEFVQSMLLMYEDGGLIPRGPSGGNYTYVMTGASTTPFIVSAFMKGIRNFDINLAYEGLRKNHMPGGLMSKVGYEHNTVLGGGLEFYLERGYIPYPLTGPEYDGKRPYGYHQDGAGQTLEYAYQDWTMACLADALDHDDDYEMFMNRAENYQHLFDHQYGWMNVKKSDGTFREPFDSLSYDQGWVEANAVQSTWFVPHDVEGLIQLMGGNEAFNKKLNRAFEISEQFDFKSSKHGDRSGTVNKLPYINYGNQPSMQVAYLFNYSGAPWLTQKWARSVIDKVYSGVSPEFGYSGDEDQGLMGSLAVLMKIGLFSMRGGAFNKPTYEISSPIFDRIKIHLDPNYYPGKTFTITTKNNTPSNPYIQSASLQGKPLMQPWFFHDLIIQGGELILQLGPEPNKDWGSHPTAAPPSMSNELFGIE